MSIQFDWQLEDEERLPEKPSPLKVMPLLVVLLLTAVAIGLLAHTWYSQRQQSAEREDAWRMEVQALLDLERQAVLAGDGELFLSLQIDDPAWLSAQLRPENQLPTRAGLQVTRAEQRENEIWANVTWRDDAGSWQRVAFFRRQAGRLLHTGIGTHYWGSQRQTRHDWGSLIFHEADQEWADLIAIFIGDAIADHCPCLPSRPSEHAPLTVVITSDFSETAVPGKIHLPSPRLLALDEEGQPAPLFWQQLRQVVEAHLSPAAVRFAVPPTAVAHYQQAAAIFMAAQPGIRLEIISLATLPEDPLLWSTLIDGAAAPPTLEMITAGRVRDLTDFMMSDPHFDRSDFYEQIWQGAWWQERMWLMPQAAGIKLLFYDIEAYRQTGRPEPSPGWTWEQMREDTAVLIAEQPDAYLQWAFLDTGRDSLFSYAYSQNGDCSPLVPARCYQSLRPPDVAAALQWYNNLAGQPGQMPDLTHLTAAERELWAINVKGPRKVALWVEEPVYYELYVLRQPMGVVSFPGTTDSEGITPLWVEGSFISQQSARPLAVWQWLKFLTYQRMDRQLRLVPARPSVAAQTYYWTNLPHPLAGVMLSAFPGGRPVTIEDQLYFSWEQITAVVSGEKTAQEAAQIGLKTDWFR